MSRPKLERPVYRLTKRPGKRKWYVTWTEAGGSKYTSTGIEIQEPGNPDEEPAADAQAYLSEFARAQNAPSADPTIGELLDKRMDAWKGMRPRSKAALSAMKSIHNHLKGFFGTTRPADITPQLLLDYHQHREDNSKRPGGGRPITAITRELEELRTTCLSSKANKWISEAPQITYPAKRPPRELFMSRAQGLKLIKAAKSAHIALFIKIALATGHRRGAILALTWDRVDFDRGILDFRNPDEQETKKRRGVCEVPHELIVELQKAYREHSRKHDRVIEFRGKPVADVKRGFAEAAIAAGLVVPGKHKNDPPKPWVTPHICKHTAISWLAEDGWPVDRISDFTETDVPTVRRVYRKVNPESLRGLRDSLGAILYPRARKPKGGVNPTPGRKNAKRR